MRTSVIGAMLIAGLSFVVAIRAHAEGANDCNYLLLQEPEGYGWGAGCPMGPCGPPGGGECKTQTGYVGEEYFMLCHCEGGTVDANCITRVRHDGNGNITGVDCMPNGCPNPPGCHVRPVGTGPAATCKCE